MYFTFESPYYLFFLLMIPLFFLIYVVTIRKKGSRAIRFANIAAIEKIKGVSLVSKNIALFSLTVLLTLCIVLSLSGMTLHTTMKATSFSYVIAIDSSSSMKADDYSPNRMEMARQAALGFVDSTSAGTDLGVISFSGTGKIEKRITEDKQAVKYAIREVEAGNIGGTNILDAVRAAVSLLYDENAKAIILLSDGQVNVKSVEEIVGYANDNDILIHTIGIGSKEGGRVSRYFLSKLDEESLKSLAYNTKGEYYHVRSREDLESAFNSILKETKSRVSILLSPYLLILSAIIIFVKWFLSNTMFRVIP